VREFVELTQAAFFFGAPKNYCDGGVRVAGEDHVRFGALSMNSGVSHNSVRLPLGAILLRGETSSVDG
jgi:hypothetical protein